MERRNADSATSKPSAQILSEIIATCESRLHDGATIPASGKGKVPRAPIRTYLARLLQWFVHKVQ